MTIQQLTYFLATVEHGSFSAAARSLYLTQPSISEQVRQLEAELGISLFARAGRGLVLTEAGRRFRPEAERVLADVERAATPSPRCAISAAAPWASGCSGRRRRT